MAVERETGLLPATYAVVDAGVDFCREDDGSVCIGVEYDDSTWAGAHTSTRYVTISGEDWAALVAALGEMQ